MSLTESYEDYSTHERADDDKSDLHKGKNGLHIVQQPVTPPVPTPEKRETFSQYVDGLIASHKEPWIDGVVGRAISHYIEVFPSLENNAEPSENKTEAVPIIYVRNSLTHHVNRVLGFEERPSLPQGTVVQFKKQEQNGNYTMVLRKKEGE